MTIAFDLYRQANGSLNSRNWAGSVPVSGGNAALGWSAANGLQEGETLTITTDGALDFGAVGPNFIFLMDTYNAQGSTLTIANDIEIGSGVTLDNYADQFELENTDKLGRAIKMGSNGTGQNPTTVQGRIWLDFPAHPRMFESRATYWPAANQANAEANLNGTNVWQLKNVWKMSDRNFGSEDTDLFMSGEGYSFYNPQTRFKKDAVIASNSITTVYLDTSQGHPMDDADTYKRPRPEVFFHEALIDQKNFDGVTPNNEIDYRVVEAGVGQINRVQRNDLILAVPSGGTRVINSLSYPGYVRGFSIPQNENFYEADFYFANGDGAACRVYISDHADFFQASKYAAMKPLSWTNNLIEMKFRSGIFQGDLTGCHINIIGIANTQIGSIAL